jgi:hypothetical protein
MSSLDHLFEVIGSHSRIQTDRLHVAIAGALLGREVHLHPNSYYKNQAVYDYSLEQYENVTFVVAEEREWPPGRASLLDKLSAKKTRTATDVAEGQPFIGSGRIASRPPLKVESSLGDVVDRAIILQLKADSISAVAALAHVRAELSALNAAWSAACLPAMESLAAWKSLKETNEQIWRSERFVRTCEERRDFGLHFIEHARRIYKLNDRRAELKRAISEALGSRLVEQKSYGAGRRDRLFLDQDAALGDEF